MFFGSAVNNFGVQLLLDAFLARSHRRRAASVRRTRHRARGSGVLRLRFQDPGEHGSEASRRIAFVRVCSGKFERDMMVTHARRARRCACPVRTSFSGSERETVDEAFAGDIIGLVGHDEFRHRRHADGGPDRCYTKFRAFTPECFAYLHNPNTAKFKRFREGLDQLLQEGVMQVFYCAIPASACRCWPRSARCNSKWCSTDWKRNTAHRRDWKRRHGKR